MKALVRVAAATPVVRVADVDWNAGEIIRLSREIASECNPSVIVFPELAVTGYTCGDLFFQQALIHGAERAVERICSETANLSQTLVVGCPVASSASLYDAAVVIREGKIMGIATRTLLGAAESRWFSISDRDSEVFFAGRQCRMGGALSIEGLTVSVGCPAAAGPSDIVLCPAASYELAGRHTSRKALFASAPGAYVYSCNGYGESTDDFVWAGSSLIYENGRLLAENRRFRNKSGWIFADISADSPAIAEEPSDYLEDIFNIQTTALMSRLEHINCHRCVIGVSGGLDSTLALLVICEAFDRLGYDRKDIYGVTMPCFGTSDRTHSNAWKLMESLGITAMEINIGKAVTQHFEDIGQDPSVHDVTFENAQARERTQILMDLSNKVGGIVVGTGDLSEIALGWCTYNGDHMSMYGVNSGVPKTLMRSMVRRIAKGHPCEATLLDIVDTPVSPELLPGQVTEEAIGPYELHDFFLERVARGDAPRDIHAAAVKAFDGQYDSPTILKWLKIFYKRFFTQQFKRACSPCGPKVLDVSLSPRGDWMMPTDASADIWLKELDNL